MSQYQTSQDRTVLLPDLTTGKLTGQGTSSGPKFSTWSVKMRETADFFSLCFLLPLLSGTFHQISFSLLLFSALNFRWKHLDQRELSLNNNLSCSTFSKNQVLLVTEDLVKVCLGFFLTATNNPSPISQWKTTQASPQPLCDVSYRNTTILERYKWCFCQAEGFIHSNLH